MFLNLKQSANNMLSHCEMLFVHFANFPLPNLTIVYVVSSCLQTCIVQFILSLFQLLHETFFLTRTGRFYINKRCGKRTQQRNKNIWPCRCVIHNIISKLYCQGLLKHNQK
jgi:hypothetical protein